MSSVRTSLLPVLVIFSGFSSIHAQTELTDNEGGEGSSGEYGTISSRVHTSLRLLDDIDLKTSNISDIIHRANKTMPHLTSRPDLVETDLKINIYKQNDLVNSTTEQGHNVSAPLNITTDANNLASSKCDLQPGECCTAAVVGEEYTEMSARRHHTVVNMTSAGLQEYTMYFAMLGVSVELLLSPTSPVNGDDLNYRIFFTSESGGNIFMWERLPRSMWKSVQDVYTSNILSSERYTFYYLSISGDTLEVGRRGEPPLMTHTGTGLRRLRYFSFKQGDEEYKALYDCTAE